MPSDKSLSPRDTLMTFPADFLIKVIGLNTLDFKKNIEVIVMQYYPNTPKEKIVSRMSENKNYCAVSVTVFATNQVTLDALYQALTALPDVRMVL